jgi:hypothetical protein
MNVISYFNLIANEKLSKESGDLISIWKQSWIQQGWSPIVLDENCAQKNDLYQKLSFNNPNSNFYKENPVGSFEYNRCCYLRLLAYCQYVKENGPTLYCDYDAINYGLRSDILNKIDKNSVLCEQRSFIYLDEFGARDIERVLIECENTDKLEWHHRNDMRLMEHETTVFKLLINKEKQYIYCCSAYTDRDHICPLVHYNGGCYLRGAPKHLSRSEVVWAHGRLKNANITQT